MTPITLSPGQQTALEAFTAFLLDPLEEVFVLKGYSGTGKSTLVKTLIERLPSIMKTVRLINPSQLDRQVQLTATTNKACEALAQISQMDVMTIHSFLGLRVSTDYKTGVSTLVPKDKNNIKYDYLLFVDEASYIDGVLLDHLFKLTKHCKIVLMGDPAQLIQFNTTTAPAFEAPFPGAELTEVMRQAKGNPIIDLATAFRHTVNTGEWGVFEPDGEHVVHLPRDQWEQAIVNEFSTPGWHYNRSKVLAWTNRAVIRFNNGINNLVHSTPSFREGDYAICNRYMGFKHCTLKTDQTVMISHMGPPTLEHDVLGNFLEIDGKVQVFMPKSLDDKKALIKQAQADDNLGLVAHIDRTWIDLRAAFAQTINKSQGSTYDEVFIDLDDVAACNSGNQIARMLYVGTSRARYKVWLTGDLA